MSAPKSVPKVTIQTLVLERKKEEVWGTARNTFAVSPNF